MTNCRNCNHIIVGGGTNSYFHRGAGSEILIKKGNMHFMICPENNCECFNPEPNDKEENK